MGKAILRLTIIGVALYFAICYFYAQFYGIDLLRNTYTLLFELCAVVMVFEEDSKYFCKFIRWTMLAIFISDIVSHVDYYYNILTVDAHNYMLAFILFCGFATSCALAIRHFYRVNKLKQKRNSYAEYYRLKRD